jgi:hypothetical protein
MRYYGAAWMAVEKPNHLWVTIEPQRLAPHEQRGPRMYTLAVESAPARANLPRAVGTRSCGAAKFRQRHPDRNVSEIGEKMFAFKDEYSSNSR